MPSSPETPLHSRNTSTADSYSHSPLGHRHSRSSIISDTPRTPVRNSFGHGDTTLDMNVFGSGGHDMMGAGGLGNLADELAGAFDEDEDDDVYYDEPEPDSSAIGLAVTTDDVRATRDSGVDVNSPPEGKDAKTRGGQTLNLPVQARGHRRTGSEYDGSEYGSESDLDSPGLSTNMVSKMADIEALARRGTENNGSPSDGVFDRVTDMLRDLGSQGGVESGTTRLITTHHALSSHMTHQTRQLQSFNYSLFAPTSLPPDPATADELLPLLDALSESIPRPAVAAHGSLAALHSATADLVTTINYLSDTLTMSRQTTIKAARNLRTVKELVAEARIEEEQRAEAERWLARHDWGERLRARECAAVCGDVVGGFEEVCNSWRARILAQAEAGAASG